MTSINSNKVGVAGFIMWMLLTLQCSLGRGQGNEKPLQDSRGKEVYTQALPKNQNTTFPQIHTNLNGMVREFVRTMYQDNKGNYWFGTNGNGIIRYDGQTLATVSIEGVSPFMRVIKIVEDKAGHVWFGTSEGLIKYDGAAFTTFSKKDGLQGADAEIWGLTIDKSGRIWVGSMGGVSHFDGEKFTPFPLPVSKVENAKAMLSDHLVFKMIEDSHGTMWFVTDGNGIFTYSNGTFTHLTTQNGLVDNHAADIFEDSRGNIWIGTFYGGVSKFNGKTYTHFTKEGIIAGDEAYNLYEDSQGNVWFTAEGFGVYRYDGDTFKQFTTEDGLTSNVTLSIFEDQKGQLWFGSWQGLCIFDGEKFEDAKHKAPWTN